MENEIKISTPTNEHENDQEPIKNQNQSNERLQSEDLIKKYNFDTPIKQNSANLNLIKTMSLSTS